MRAASHDPCQNQHSALSRRDFFSRLSDGLHGTALACLLGQDLFAVNPALLGGHRETYDLTPRTPHFDGKAKAMIQLFMTGGPSQVDLFDPKPVLEKHAGQPPGRDLIKDILFIADAGGMMPSPFRFSRQGQSGMELSELLPHLSRHADDIALIRSMYTTNFTHGPATFLMQGGHVLTGRPSMGAWVVYALGSESQDLPAYVVLDDPAGLPSLGIRNWQSAWLPAIYQGTRLRSEGSPILNLKPRQQFPNKVQELARSLLNRLAKDHRDQRPGHADLEARIASYELAGRMQVSSSDALDVSQESRKTREMYGLNDPMTAPYARRCLMARRLVERGVRLVQIYARGGMWDNHSSLEKGLRDNCAKTDKPVAALLADLKQRGLLDTTLILWGGEFGRLPLSQVSTGKADGRDHGPTGFTVWMAGGGVRPGVIYGATDDLGYKAVENPVSVHDLHATILHLLGLDHQKLVFSHNSLDEKLTGQEPARVVQGILI